MEPVTFKQAVCSLHRIPEENYDDFVFARTLFHRVRLIKPFLNFFYPDFLFNEKRLIEKIGAAQTLREVQEEVDFYQHKYVVNFVAKDALRFRASGMKILSLANKAFKHSKNQIKSGMSADPKGQEPVNP